MKKNKRTITLLMAGLFVLAATQILSHYTQLPDVVHGLLMGAGIGLALTSILIRFKKPKAT